MGNGFTTSSLCSDRAFHSGTRQLAPASGTVVVKLGGFRAWRRPYFLLTANSLARLPSEGSAVCEIASGPSGYRGGADRFTTSGKPPNAGAQRTFGFLLVSGRAGDQQLGFRLSRYCR